MRLLKSFSILVMLTIFSVSLNYSVDTRFKAIEKISFEEGINYRFIDDYFKANPEELDSFRLATIQLKARHLLDDYLFPELLFAEKLNDILADEEFKTMLLSRGIKSSLLESLKGYKAMEPSLLATELELVVPALEDIAGEGSESYREIVNQIKSSSFYEMYGYVFDAYTYQPINKSQVALMSKTRHKIVDTVTNATGLYSLKVNIGARALSPFDIAAGRVPDYVSKRNNPFSLPMIGEPYHLYKAFYLYPARGTTRGIVQDSETKLPIEKVQISVVQEADKTIIAKFLPTEDGRLKKHREETDNPLPSTETREDGGFSFAGHTGNRTVKFEKKGYPVITKSLPFDFRQAKGSQRIFLDSRLVEVSFKITDSSTGEAVPFALVSFNDEAPVLTDKSGVVVNSFPRNSELHVVVKKMYYNTKPVVFEITKKKYRQPFSIELEPTVIEINGRLLSSEGVPVSDARIMTPLPEPVLTDEDGLFSYSINASRDQIMAIDKEGFMRDTFFPDYTPYYKNGDKLLNDGDVIVYSFDKLIPEPVYPTNNSFVLGNLVEFEFNFPAIVKPKKGLVKLFIDGDEFSRPVIKKNGNVQFTCPDIAEGSHLAYVEARYFTDDYWNALKESVNFTVGKPEFLDSFELSQPEEKDSFSVISFSLDSGAVDISKTRLFINDEIVKYDVSETDGKVMIKGKSEKTLFSVKLAVAHKDGTVTDIFYYPLY